jgi:hypothetical protein
MSSVTAVTLQVDSCEDFYAPENGDRIIPIVAQINQWLASNGYHRGLVRVEQHYGGTKHPQVLVYGAGLNHLCEDALAAFVLGLPWSRPENVVLLLNPEEGATRVFRPSFEEQCL